MGWKWWAEFISAALLIVVIFHPMWVYVAAPFVLFTAVKAIRD